MPDPTTGIALNWLDRARTAEARVKELEAALRPLAAIAVAIDDACPAQYRPGDDEARLWVADARQSSPLDLTIGHARAARRALGAVSDG